MPSFASRAASTMTARSTFALYHQRPPILTGMGSIQQRGKVEGGRGGGGWPERRHHGWVAHIRGLGRATVWEWRCPGLSSDRKRVTRRQQTISIHKETGRNRSRWRGNTAEEDSRPVTGGTTPLRTSRDQASGQGRQGGGVFRVIVEKGCNL